MCNFSVCVDHIIPFSRPRTTYVSLAQNKTEMNDSHLLMDDDHMCSPFTSIKDVGFSNIKRAFHTLCFGK